MKKPKVALSRMSFGAASTGDESVNAPFPLSVEKVKKNEEVKLRVNDVIADIISFSHATQLSKKQLIEDIKVKYPELKKTHVDTFVKECFEKQKRPADSKVSNNSYFICYRLDFSRSTMLSTSMGALKISFSSCLRSIKRS
jgi:hypothetical protein